MPDNKKVSVQIISNLGDWKPGDVVEMDAKKAKFFSMTQKGRPPVVSIIKKPKAPKLEEPAAASED